MNKPQGSIFKKVANAVAKPFSNPRVAALGKYVLIGGGLFVVILVSLAVWNAIDEGKSYRRGLALIEQRKYDAGAKLLAEAVQKDADNKKLWRLYGEASYKAGLAGEAARAFITVLRLDPEYDGCAGVAELIGFYTPRDLSQGAIDISFDVDPKNKKVYLERIAADTNEDGDIDEDDRVEVYCGDLGFKKVEKVEAISPYRVYAFNVPSKGGLLFFSGYDRKKVVHYTLERIAALYYSGAISYDAAERLYGTTSVPDAGLYRYVAGEVTPIVVDDYNNYSPYASPDGNLVIFASNRPLKGEKKSKKGTHCFVDVRSGTVKTVFEDTASERWGVSQWLPDSKGFVYNVYAETPTGYTRSSTLSVYDVKGKKAKKLGESASYYNFDVAPDGKKLVANRIEKDYNGDGLYTKADGYETVLLDIASGEETVVFDYDAEIKPVFLDWNADGSGIIFVAIAYGRSAIYSYKFDEECPRCILSADYPLLTTFESAKWVGANKLYLTVGEYDKKEYDLTTASRRICAVDLSEEFDPTTTKLKLAALAEGGGARGY